MIRMYKRQKHVTTLHASKSKTKKKKKWTDWRAKIAL